MKSPYFALCALFLVGSISRPVSAQDYGAPAALPPVTGYADAYPATGIHQPTPAGLGMLPPTAYRTDEKSADSPSDLPSPQPGKFTPAPMSQHPATTEIGGTGCTSCGSATGCGCAADHFPSSAGMPGGGWLSSGWHGWHHGFSNLLGATGLFRGASSDCWFGSVDGLYMFRSRDNNLPLTVNIDDKDSKLLDTHDLNNDWSGGFEARVGRYINCGQNAIEGLYWGLYPDTESRTVYGDKNKNVWLGSLLDFDGLKVGDHDGNELFTNADYHTVTHSFDVHNAEINLLGGSLCGGLGRFNGCGSHCGSRCGGLRLSWLAGFRYLRFDESLGYGSSVVPCGCPDDERVDTWYKTDVENNLFGFQVGGRGDYCVSRKLTLVGSTKVALFGNHMRRGSSINTNKGFATVSHIDSKYFGTKYAFDHSDNNFSVLGELDLGLRYQVTCNLKARAGWRVMGVSGVATSVQQVPRNFDNFNNLETINGEGSLILNGGYAGLEWNF